MHAAFAAFIIAAVAQFQFNRINLVHAVMNGNHKAGANGKVNKEQYGSGKLFHLRNKYRQIMYKQKMICVSPHLINK
jgi:hypothetical protein